MPIEYKYTTSAVIKLSENPDGTHKGHVFAQDEHLVTGNHKTKDKAAAAACATAREVLMMSAEPTTSNPPVGSVKPKGGVEQPPSGKLSGTGGKTVKSEG